MSLRLFDIVQPFDEQTNQPANQPTSKLTDLTRLAGLAADDFILVPDALALVWLRRSQSADDRRDLADLLAVRTFDRDRARFRIGADLDAGRRLDAGRVRITQEKQEQTPPPLSPLADPLHDP